MKRNIIFKFNYIISKGIKFSKRVVNFFFDIEKKCIFLCLEVSCFVCVWFDKILDGFTLLLHRSSKKSGVNDVRESQKKYIDGHSCSYQKIISYNTKSKQTVSAEERNAKRIASSARALNQKCV